MPRPERILVTGAAGFIGARVVEALSLTGSAIPRAGIRRWSSAARLGRLPVEIVPCDVMSPEQLARAMRGVDAVVHAAYGPGNVNSEGTRRTLEAACAANVRRVVHLSTVSIYGATEGRLPEAAPSRRGFGEYGDTKIDAETICWSYAARGLEVVVLRPSLVYGPFGNTWTIRYARLLSQGRWRLPRGFGEGTCNLLYVDDLVRAILLALDTPGVAGEAFNVSGPERPTWREYLEALNEACGFPPIPLTSGLSYRASDVLTSPLRVTARFALRRLGPLVRAVHQRSRWARRTMKATESRLRTTGTAEELRFYGRENAYPIEKARSLLGYDPLVGMNEGIARSVSWLRHHGYLDGSLRV